VGFVAAVSDLAFEAQRRYGKQTVSETMNASEPVSPSKIADFGAPSFWARLGLTVVFVAIAFLATISLQHLFPYPFLFLFFGAVMASAWFGGTAAGLLAVLLSTALVEYFFVPPFYSFAINATAETYFAAFVVCALLASWVSSSRKKSAEALRVARDELEVRVLERTEELRKSNLELQEREKALLHSQAELARLSRVMSMGELTVSIAHEINQPLTAVVTHGHACMEWLSADPPNVSKARQTTERIIQDGTRAGAVLAKIRALFNNEAPTKAPLDINQLIEELTWFVRDEAANRSIVMRTELAAGLPLITADRVQLQQVMLNLIMNAMDAVLEKCADREIVIGTSRDGESEIVIGVQDSGVGMTPELAGKVFEPFFTTKPHGIGLGLSISRSITEAHGGRLRAAPRPSGGAIFQVIIPIQQQATDG
jgi:C4-dicarboxylate-specific signal transduction histidine kinase